MNAQYICTHGRTCTHGATFVLTWPAASQSVNNANHTDVDTAFVGAVHGSDNICTADAKQQIVPLDGRHLPRPMQRPVARPHHFGDEEVPMPYGPLLQWTPVLLPRWVVQSRGGPRKVLGVPPCLLLILCAAKGKVSLHQQLPQQITRQPLLTKAVPSSYSCSSCCSSRCSSCCCCCCCWWVRVDDQDAWLGDEHVEVDRGCEVG